MRQQARWRSLTAGQPSSAQTTHYVAASNKSCASTSSTTAASDRTADLHSGRLNRQVSSDHPAAMSSAAIALAASSTYETVDAGVVAVGDEGWARESPA
jgi:hypothetical protein